MEKFLKPIRVKVFYDKNLGKITGKDSEEVVVSENLDFISLLNFIFSAYPEIPKKFMPGTLGLLLNDKAPKENDILRDKDEVKIMALGHRILSN